MQDNEKESRADGYKNLMNKYGTQDDVSEQYRFESDDPVTDVELTLNYEENGLFAKIIDIPSDDAVSSGFEYGVTLRDYGINPEHATKAQRDMADCVAQKTGEACRELRRYDR